MDNAQFTFDITVQHVDLTTQYISKFGVGRVTIPPNAHKWTRLGLLVMAKTDLGVK